MNRTNSAKTLKVLVTEDHTLLRELISAHLQEATDFETHEAATYQDAMQSIAQEGPFDVILLDPAMPGMYGLESIEKVVSANKPGNVAILAFESGYLLIEQALKLGAKGFLPKTMHATAFIHAIRFLAYGEVYVPAGFLDANGPNGQSKVTLSQTHWAVLDGLKRGRSNKEIAREISMTESVVKSHVRAIMKKLGADNRTHAVVLANRWAE